MVEVALKDGEILNVTSSFDFIHRVMNDSFVYKSTFIPLETEVGTYYIQKGSIIGYLDLKEE